MWWILLSQSSNVEDVGIAQGAESYPQNLLLGGGGAFKAYVA